MLLKYSEVTEQGYLVMISVVIEKQIQAWKKRKAKEGAETGF